jgi:hypothetical protein
MTIGFGLAQAKKNKSAVNAQRLVLSAIQPASFSASRFAISARIS